MTLTRVWAMPNKWTFQIPCIKKLVSEYVADGTGWIDPFAGENSPAEFTNDLNPSSPAKYHLPALEFVESMIGNKFNGVLFDPPYSLRQVKECYDGIGKKMSAEDSRMFPTNVKSVLSNCILPGGYALSFGWNSIGFGKSRGFELMEVLLVCHGGRHNDTIVTVEKKINNTLDQYTDETD